MCGTTLTSVAKVNSLIRWAVIAAVAITGASVPMAVLVIQECTRSMLSPCWVRTRRALSVAPAFSANRARVFFGTVVVPVTRAVTGETVAIFVVRKTTASPMAAPVWVRALSAHRCRCSRFRTDSSCVLWGTGITSVTCTLTCIPIAVFVIHKLCVGLVLLSIRGRARSTLRRDVTHPAGGAAPRTSVTLTFAVVLYTVLHPLKALARPVCGAFMGTGSALVWSVTADIRHLSVTIVTSITRTLTVNHVTLIVNNCKFCVWRVIFSLHVAFSTRGLRPRGWRCGGGLIVTNILPGISTPVSSAAIAFTVVALTAAVDIKRLLGGVLPTAHGARLTVAARVDYWRRGGRSATDIGPRGHALVVTVTETLTPISKATLFSEELGLSWMNFAINTARFARLEGMRVVWLITNILCFCTITRVTVITLTGTWHSPVPVGQSEL